MRFLGIGLPLLAVGGALAAADAAGLEGVAPPLAGFGWATLALGAVFAAAHLAVGPRREEA